MDKNNSGDDSYLQHFCVGFCWLCTNLTRIRAQGVRAMAWSVRGARKMQPHEMMVFLPRFFSESLLNVESTRGPCFQSCFSRHHGLDGCTVAERAWNSSRWAVVIFRVLDGALASRRTGSNQRKKLFMPNCQPMEQTYRVVYRKSMDCIDCLAAAAHLCRTTTSKVIAIGNMVSAGQSSRLEEDR